MESNNLKINEDVIVHFRDGSWQATNPRVRTHVEFTPESIQTFIKLTANDSSYTDWSNNFSSLRIKDRTERAIGKNGLVSDHSAYDYEELHSWIEGETALELLCSKAILLKDNETGFENVKDLTGLLDRNSLGTFHQRVGQHIMVDKRAKEPWREWQNQKFSPDGKSLLNTSYKKIQEPFFDSFFSKEKVSGKRILDFGCGNGYYTSKLSLNGAIVKGLDNSAELLDLANENFSSIENLEFKKTDTFDDVVSLLGTWEENSIDYIILQDTILLLISPENISEAPDLAKLLNAFKRVLKNDGVLYAMEPNPLFWLSSRMGNNEKPYTVITEYSNRVFNAAPNIDTLLSHMSAGGFALKSVEHPQPTDISDSQYSYQKEFPIWDFYSFVLY